MKLFNIYGTTECSCWATANEIILNNVQDNEDLQCIGLPFHDTLLKVFDENQKEVVGNGVGEIWIGGEKRICIVGDEIHPPM